MNIDKFTIDTQPFEKTLTFRLASPALDQSAAAALGEWNSPLIYGEFDKNNIYYDITGRVPLRQTLGHPLSCEEAVNLFISVADAILYAQENAVHPKYVILDSDLVFVSEASGAIRLICVPTLDGGLQNKPLRAYIKELVVNMQYDEMENLEYIGKIINYLNRNKKLDPEAFIEFLEGLLDRQAAYIKGDEAVIPQVQPTASAPGYKKAAAALEHPVKTAEDVKEAVSLPPQSDGWDERPQENVQENEVDIESVLKNIEAEAMDVAHHSRQEDKGADDLAEVFKSMNTSAEAPKEIHYETPIQSVASEVISEDAHHLHTARPYMIRMKNGEKVVIDKDEFKIGKIPGMADYLLSDNPAVSRMHAIIHRIDGAYYVCDNYSTNATYLNGEQLEPGKNYLLISGVRIDFANDEFTYYMD